MLLSPYPGAVKQASLPAAAPFAATGCDSRSSRVRIFPSTFYLNVKFTRPRSFPSTQLLLCYRFTTHAKAVADIQAQRACLEQ